MMTIIFGAIMEEGLFFIEQPISERLFFDASFRMMKWKDGLPERFYFNGKNMPMYCLEKIEERSIEKCYLSKEASELLKDAKISTLQQFSQMTEAEQQKIVGLNALCLEEIREKCNSYGIPVYAEAKESEGSKEEGEVVRIFRRSDISLTNQTIRFELVAEMSISDYNEMVDDDFSDHVFEVEMHIPEKIPEDVTDSQYIISRLIHARNNCFFA